MQISFAGFAAAKSGHMDEPALRAGEKRRSVFRFVLAATLLALLLFALAVPLYLTVPLRNTPDNHVDCLLVLGSPTEIDGSLSSEQRWRVDEAVRLYHDGRAPRILMSGGPTSKGYVEARSMAQYAVQLGVPPSVILEEGASMNTRENVQNSEQILQAHGWQRVEVISSAEHLPRAALLLSHSHLLWRMHAAPTPGRSSIQRAGAYAEEAFATAVIRCLGLRALPVLHAFAVVQHGLAFGVRWVFYNTRAKL